MDKASLRSYYRTLRAQISSDLASHWSDKLVQDLRMRLRLSGFDGVLYLFFPIPGEPDLVSRLGQDRTQIAMPRIIDKTKMSFYLWSYGDPVRIGSFGIMEPVDLSFPVEPKFGDVAIVPALAADIHGYRLGYGGGYYDRWLSQFRSNLAFVAGAVFPPCVTKDRLPFEPHDQPLDVLLSAT
jgi:5-formyltetrahydrofolate cyclo-ligase